MRLILAEPDPMNRNEKRVYQCGVCQILETVLSEY
jgi:hypothetical protein